MAWLTIFLLGVFQVTFVIGRSVPDNVRSFYDSVQRAGACTGSDLLQGGFYNTEDGAAEYGYCQKGVAGRAIYLKGPGNMLANMDVDCDGEQTDLDSRCQASTDTQAQTTFQSEVQPYGLSDLRADIHPYVVFGNQGNYSPTFDPQKGGVLPLSIVAVVCGDQLIYAIWGDTNGDDGKPLVGEASLAVATACYGQGVSGNNGHDEEDVLYIAFVGRRAVPGDAAKWNASSYEDFASSISKLGDELVSALPASINVTITDMSSGSLRRDSITDLAYAMIMVLGLGLGLGLSLV